MTTKKAVAKDDGPVKWRPGVYLEPDTKRLAVAIATKRQHASTVAGAPRLVSMSEVFDDAIALLAQKEGVD